MMGMGFGGKLPEHSSWVGAAWGGTVQAAKNVTAQVGTLVTGNQHFPAAHIPARDLPAMDIPASKCGDTIIPAAHIPARHVDAMDLPARDMPVSRMQTLKNMGSSIVSAYQSHMTSVNDPEKFKQWNAAVDKFQTPK